MKRRVVTGLAGLAAGVSGYSAGWESASFDLTPLFAALGRRFQLAFEVGSDGSRSYDGWAIDQLQVLAR